MPRFNATLSIAVLTIAIPPLVLAVCGGAGPTASPTLAAIERPAFSLHIDGGPASGTYESSESATLNLCSRLDDGSWRAMYAGGDPWLSLDMHVGALIAEAGHESEVALEISARSGYLWIDQGGFRGGDKPGRSKVAASADATDATTTFVVKATTPNRSNGVDGQPADIELTLACPT